MKVSIEDFKIKLNNRLPQLKLKDIDKYFSAIINILKERIINNEIVIIDNFGVLCRKDMKPRRVINVTTGKPQIITPRAVVFRPNYYFRLYFKDEKNRERMKKILIDRSKKALIKLTGRKKNII